MSLSFYKVIHILGLLLVFNGLAAIWGVNVVGGTPSKRRRIGLSLMHGLGLAALLISGFGMLAKLGYLSDIPTWAIIKSLIWLAMGASLALAKRKAQWGLPLISFFVLAGTYAAYLCIYKPG